MTSASSIADEAVQRIVVDLRATVLPASMAEEKWIPEVLLPMILAFGPGTHDDVSIVLPRFLSRHKSWNTPGWDALVHHHVIAKGVFLHETWPMNTLFVITSLVIGTAPAASGEQQGA